MEYMEGRGLIEKSYERGKGLVENVAISSYREKGSKIAQKNVV